MAAKERIYTIPVNDAFHSEAECPLCWLQAKADEEMLEYYLGPSLMEPDTRQLTNRQGFCPVHLGRMYSSQKNRLGLGLMLHTHLQENVPLINRRLQKAIPSGRTPFFGGKSKENYKDNLRTLAAELRQETDDCVICDRIRYTLDRYLDVIFWQYFNEESFRDSFSRARGFCRPHVAALLEGAAAYLNQEEARAFVGDLSEKQAAMYDELISDVEWFTLKFDYRNQDKPWGNAKDAVPRAIRRLEGDLELK